MKYLRRELNQVEKEYLKQFGEDSLNRVILHDPNTKDKQEVQDTIDILKEAIAKNKPLEQVPEDMWNLAYRTKSVCENPYNTSKYLVL